jgi:hypothetical protein
VSAVGQVRTPCICTGTMEPQPGPTRSKQSWRRRCQHRLFLIPIVGRWRWTFLSMAERDFERFPSFASQSRVGCRPTSEPVPWSPVEEGASTRRTATGQEMDPALHQRVCGAGHRTISRRAAYQVAPVMTHIPNSQDSPPLPGARTLFSFCASLLFGSGLISSHNRQQVRTALSPAFLPKSCTPCPQLSGVFTTSTWNLHDVGRGRTCRIATSRLRDFCSSRRRGRQAPGLAPKRPRLRLAI